MNACANIAVEQSVDKLTCEIGQCGEHGGGAYYMGKRGPHKTPTAILQARGNPNLGDRHDLEVIPANSLPAAPSSLDDNGMAAWNYYGPMLLHMGVYTEGDAMVLEQLCSAWQSWRAAEDEIAAKGHDYQTESGDWKEYPHTKRAAQWWDRVLKALSHFGLTPATRPDVPRATKRVKSLAEEYG